jgi:ABC-type transporter Mla subunit MlaD
MRIDTVVEYVSLLGSKYIELDGSKQNSKRHTTAGIR